MPPTVFALVRYTEEVRRSAPNLPDHIFTCALPIKITESIPDQKQEILRGLIGTTFTESDAVWEAEVEIVAVVNPDSPVHTFLESMRLLDALGGYGINDALQQLLGLIQECGAPDEKELRPAGTV